MSGQAALRTQEAAQLLGVSCNTLRDWAKRNLIDFQITPGGQRRFDVSSLRRPDATVDRSHHFTSTPRLPTPAPPPKAGAIYCRVSSRKQQDNLERQKQALQARFPDHKLYVDIASGLDYKRQGLGRLLAHAHAGLISEVVVAHRDRLARFGVELIESMLKQAGVSLVDLDQPETSEQQEITEDLMAIVHGFSCQLNSRGRYPNAQPGPGRIASSSDAMRVIEIHPAPLQLGQTTRKKRQGGGAPQTHPGKRRRPEATPPVHTFSIS